jgi:rhodanese-related sulfurtransferase
MNKKGEKVIIDTREQHEFEKSHVDGARNIPPHKFMNGEAVKELKEVKKDTCIILYCRSGARSNTCSKILEDAGYTNLVNGFNEHRVRKLLLG